MKRGSLSEVESIQTNGARNSSAPGTISATIATLNSRSRVARRARMPGRAGAAAARSSTIASAPLDLALVVDPVRRRAEDQQREGEDDQEQHPGQGGGVAHLEVAEGVLVEVEVVEEGRAARPA